MKGRGVIAFVAGVVAGALGLAGATWAALRHGDLDRTNCK